MQSKETRMTFITPTGVERIRINRDKLEDFCMMKVFIRVNGQERRLECFIDALAFSTKTQEEKFKKYCKLGYKLAIFEK